MNDYRVTSWAADYLRQEHDSPFFLACGIFRPHLPWNVPASYFEQYPLEEIVLPEVLPDDLDDVPAAGQFLADPGGFHAAILNSGNWAKAVQAYLACISFVDAQVGRLLDALDASPHADNTVIALWSDHGIHLGEKEHWHKSTLWEESGRAPLMIAAPGVTEGGSVCETPIDLVNTYPTLADLCGLPRFRARRRQLAAAAGGPRGRVGSAGIDELPRRQRRALRPVAIHSLRRRFRRTVRPPGRSE